MAHGSQPGVYTGLLREDQANNGSAAAFATGLPPDVWRVVQQALGNTITGNTDDSWHHRVVAKGKQGT